MPEQARPGSQKQYNLEWIHIDDFSPGVYDGTNISTQEAVISAPPLGAADANSTWCCSSIPGGALAPLPALTNTVMYTPSFPGSTTDLYITGFIVTPQLNDGNYEIVTLFEGDDNTNHYVIALSYQPASSSANTISGPTNTSGTTGGGIFGSPYPAFTRMTATGTGNPPPVLVFPGAVSTDANGSSGHLWVYPKLSTPTAFTAQDLNSGTPSVTGQVICYGSRVICLAGINYSWPAGTGVNTNENFNYTDPPQSATFLHQMTLLGAEIPWGYGAWGSVSIGELLLIKKYGGAVILNGDINVPASIIEVQGVESTGDLVGSAAATPSGLYYCSQNRGAWVWNGGNTSTKISKNLRDDFFDMQTNRIKSNNYGFFAYHWQKWVMFSNNRMYDTETGAWWVIYPNNGNSVGGANPLTGRDIFWWSLTQNGNQILGAPLDIPNSNRIWYSIFDNTVPSPTYVWKSLPIHVNKNADRVVDVRQVVVRASDPTGSNTSTVRVSIPNAVGAVNNVATNPIGTNPTPLRFNCSGGGLDDIVIQVIASNTVTGHSAPIIHSIDIGYQIREGVAVVD